MKWNAELLDVLATAIEAKHLFKKFKYQSEFPFSRREGHECKLTSGVHGLPWWLMPASISCKFGI